MNGQGKEFFPDGATYTGQFKDDLKHGQGIYTYPNGERYKGEYVNNQKNGKGKFYFRNGDCFVGKWLNGQRGDGLLKKGKRAQAKEWLHEFRDHKS